MSEPKKVVSISTAGRKVMGTITVDGVEHEVKQMDFGSYQRLQEIQASPERAVPALREVVARLCPSLSDETLDALGIDDGNAILAFAGGGIAAVENAFPNAVSPEIQNSEG